MDEHISGTMDMPECSKAKRYETSHWIQATESSGSVIFVPLESFHTFFLDFGLAAAYGLALLDLTAGSRCFVGDVSSQS